jgi:rhodanese-related sulfurtransferase
MTVDDAWGRLEREEPILFIDSRNPKAWEESELKLPGAIRIPAAEVAKHASKLPHDRTLIPYCT